MTRRAAFMALLLAPGGQLVFDLDLAKKWIPNVKTLRIDFTRSHGLERLEVVCPDGEVLTFPADEIVEALKVRRDDQA